MELGIDNKFKYNHSNSDEFRTFLIHIIKALKISVSIFCRCSCNYSLIKKHDVVDI
jgi:hypothetical protein